MKKIHHVRSKQRCHWLQQKHFRRRGRILVVQRAVARYRRLRLSNHHRFRAANMVLRDVPSYARDAARDAIINRFSAFNRRQAY